MEFGEIPEPQRTPACHRLQQDILPWWQECGCSDSVMWFSSTGVVWSLGYGRGDGISPARLVDKRLSWALPICWITHAEGRPCHEQPHGAAFVARNGSLTPTATRASLEANLQLQLSLEMPAALSHSWTQSHERLQATTTQLSYSWIPDLQNLWNNNVYYLKPLSFGVICYESRVTNSVGNPFPSQFWKLCSEAKFLLRSTHTTHLAPGSCGPPLYPAYPEIARRFAILGLRFPLGWGLMGHFSLEIHFFQCWGIFWNYFIDDFLPTIFSILYSWNSFYSYFEPWGLILNFSLTILFSSVFHFCVFSLLSG